ncbi:hypothetical protein ATEG_05675 [Aspergillus terreus NIH2624]|uniref:Cytochrome b5 heme-binding domain-containing protein n=1 Tax=Aspergillus terreus (strain NIH 2624 / FGSC A1156) TaxID=341663 RepID=Q0CKV9_ASPTN|nr:uncharacterized protein ATEG_05675 [Aspergillus terreus NIH2624]EAU33436.1 hypothetical protein ATEG_05675 [Aspergillus terreus NIH2624]
MTLPPDAAGEKTRVLSHGEIEALIANGQSIVIIDQKVLRLDAWLPYHPGGYKPIQHFIGKDATNEFTVKSTATRSGGLKAAGGICCLPSRAAPIARARRKSSSLRPSSPLSATVPKSSLF